MDDFINIQSLKNMLLGLKEQLIVLESYCLVPKLRMTKDQLESYYIIS